MNNKALALLGLLAEGPKYGYQLEEDIQTRGMREWTEIGFSSIYYLLNKLAERGWVLARMEASAHGPNRKVFTLSESGLAALKIAVTDRLSNPTPNTGEFDLALAFMAVLPEETIYHALTEYQQRLEQSLARVRARFQSQLPLPPHVITLFEHSLHQMQAELTWLNHYLEQRKAP